MPKASGQGGMRELDLSAGFVPRSQAAPPEKQAPPQSFGSSYAESSGLSMLGNALLHPRDTAGAVPRRWTEAGRPQSAEQSL